MLSGYVLGADSVSARVRPPPVVFKQAFGARFFAALKNDSPKRAAKDLGGGIRGLAPLRMTLGVRCAQGVAPGKDRPDTMSESRRILF